MNHIFATVCVATAMSCVVGAESAAPGPVPPAVVMGIVPSPVPEEVREHVELNPTEGIFVKGVAPGSPAEVAGLREADIILAIDGTRILSREEYRKVVAGKKAGDVLLLLCLRAGRTLEFAVMLKPREEVLPGNVAATPNIHADNERLTSASLRKRTRAFNPESARRLAYMKSVGTQGLRPVELSPEIVVAIREARGRIIAELARNPKEVDTARLTRLMQRLRDLARDANTGRQNWMAGKAGEATLQFRDGMGTIVLTGADNLIQIELLGLDGRSIYRGPFNTEEERRIVPGDLSARFRSLQRR